MRIDDFNVGDVVVMEELENFPKRYKDRDDSRFCGVICEIYCGMSGKKLLDKPGLEDRTLFCIVNDHYAPQAVLRKMTEREEFLYKMYGFKNVKDMG